MMNLYNNIKDRRQELGITQQELARRLGYKSTSTIAKIETGNSDFPMSRLQDFSDALYTTPDRLLYGAGGERADKIISGKDLLKSICKDSPKAQELLDSMNITDTGDISIEGVDHVSAAVIGHAIRGLITALQGAEKDSDGKAKAIIKVSDLIPKTEGK